MREAELPDGTILEFPDATSDDVMQGAVKEYLGVKTGRPVQAKKAPAGAGGDIPLPETYEGDFFRTLTEEGPPAGISAYGAGKAAAGGLLKMTEGVAPLPFDIAEYFGSDKSGEIAAKIREAIPEIPADTTFEEIGQVLVQYGVPAKTAFSLTKGVLKGAPWAVRGMKNLLVGGGADLAAATPDEQSLGNLVGGPTAIDPEDPTLVKKFKTGVEGAVIPAAVGTAALPVKAAKWVGNTAIDLFRSENVARRTVEKAFQEAVQNPEQAIKQIDEAMRLVDGSGWMPTTGTASGDVGLIGLEKGAKQQFRSISDYDQRILDNRRAVSDTLSKLRDSMKGKPKATRDLYEKQFIKPLEDLEDQLVRLEDNLRGVRTETQNHIAEVSMMAGKEADASVAIDDVVRERLKALTATKNAKYAAVDPERAIVIPKERVAEAIEEATTAKSALDLTPEDLPKSIIDRLKTAVDPESEALTFGALQDIRPKLSEEIANARAANNGALVDRLVALKSAIETETDYLIMQGGEAGKKALEAKNFYQKEFVPRFKELVGDAFRRAERSGKPIPASQTGKKFLFAPSGARESAAQLRLIVEDSPNREVAIEAIRDHVGGTVGRLVRPTDTGKSAVGKLDKFLNQRNVQETLEQYPEIARELKAYRDSLAKGVTAENALVGQIRQVQQGQRMTTRQYNRHAARFFVDTEPTKAMGKVLNSADPERAMEDLVTLAKEDPSGAALDGLRTALADHLDTTLRGTKTVGDDYEVLLGAVEKLFKSKPKMKAIEQLYNKEELGVLARLRDQMRVMDKIQFQTTAGSQTAHLQENLQRARILLASWVGIIKGRGVFMIGRWAQRMMGKDPVENAERLMADALLDPELAKTMLLKDTPANRKIAEAKIAKYMVNNFAVEMTDED